ncbi:MAG: hypothetical protein AB7D00_14260, partial [Rhodospirillaceae bacterium]
MKTASLLLAVSMLATIGLAACSDRSRPPREGGPGGREARQSPALMFSPNGEPLNGGALGQPSCGLAMNSWFDRTDANHDGRLDREEFLADARAQFAKMDVNRLGYLTNDALSRYRQPFRQGTRSNNVIDPVMTADKNLNFMVTPEEFQQHAAEAFAQLAAPQGSAIDRAGLAAYCAQQAQST